MAVYRLSATMVKRSERRSAVASAAYRAGTRLVDDRTGTEHDYSRRNRRDADGHLVEPAANAESLILLPVGAPAWARDRSKLWNAVEEKERRADAQVAREVTLSLPVELTWKQRRKLARSFAKKSFVDRGMVADIAIHGQATHNPHFHVMLTTRSIGADGFGQKQRAWNDKKLLDAWRLEWETHANEALAAAGVEARIDRRSRADRGLAGAPQPKVGPGGHRPGTPGRSESRSGRRAARRLDNRTAGRLPGGYRRCHRPRPPARGCAWVAHRPGNRGAAGSCGRRRGSHLAKSRCDCRPDCRGDPGRSVRAGTAAGRTGAGTGPHLGSA